MFILSYNIKSDELENKIELLQINDIFNTFYENPLEITTNDYGYGYLEKDVDIITLKIVFEGTLSEIDEFKLFVNSILGEEPINIEEINQDFTTYNFPVIHINDKWVLAHPDEEITEKNKINFVSQGAFGTGLHETTQNILDIILTKLDLENKSVLDIGTGSGILSIASSIVGASSVAALDIRDVRDEVEYNASLNGLYNINVFIGDALTDEVIINNKFDWIYINIGGEETQMFMKFIKDHLETDGKLLVSGLVEWSFDKVKKIIEEYGFELKKSYQSNEWITAIFK